MKTIKNPIIRKQYLASELYRAYFKDTMIEYTQVLEYDAGEYVLQQSMEPVYLYLMVQGRCSVRASLANGKSVILQTLHAPCLIGEMELVRDVSPFTVQALEKCLMLVIPLKQCRNILLQDSYFLRRLCSDLVWKERMEALSLICTFGYPLENRLAKFILDNRQENCFYIKKVHIAESLGVSYRHVGKVLNDFIARRYLSKNKFVYTIIDEEALASLAEELKAAEVIGDI
ncbi:MAG: transcriptional regulator YeiL [Lachnospiraceae bacterium]|nr:transcriptional regulator YeiL [Lachnospiraceae bacterium]